MFGPPVVLASGFPILPDPVSAPLPEQYLRTPVAAPLQFGRDGSVCTGLVTAARCIIGLTDCIFDRNEISFL